MCYGKPTAYVIGFEATYSRTLCNDVLWETDRKARAVSGRKLRLLSRRNKPFQFASD